MLDHLNAYAHCHGLARFEVESFFFVKLIGKGHGFTCLLFKALFEFKFLILLETPIVLIEQDYKQ